MDLYTEQKSPVYSLKDPPKPFPKPSFVESTPVYYFDNGNFIFIVALDGIYKYDLDKQVIAEFYSYAFGSPHSCCFNPVNRTFYIIDGYLQWWITFNLDTEEWNILFEEETNSVTASNLKYIPSPINQIHVIQNDDHYIISNDINETRFVASNIGIKTIRNNHYAKTKLIYNNQTNELMAFHYGKEILLCNIYDRAQENFSWRKCRITLENYLPADSDAFEPILGYDQILLLFTLETHRKSALCIDLKHPETGQFVNGINKNITFQYVIKDNNNDIHLLQLNSNEHNDNPSYHYKISLFDLIPLEILKVNQRDFEPLVIGYCKECEKNDKVAFVPLYLKRLIVKLYPIFT